MVYSAEPPAGVLTPPVLLPLQEPCTPDHIPTQTCVPESTDQLIGKTMCSQSAVYFSQNLSIPSRQCDTF